MSGHDKYLEFQYRRTGGFFTTLFKAISLADSDNLPKLEKGFPEEVDAFKIWSRQGAEYLLPKISLDHGLRDQFMEEYNLGIESDPYHLGKNAVLDGKSRNDNPYKDEGHAAWKLGFDIQTKLVKENNNG